MNLGQEIVFKIKTDSRDYRVDIYRVGWYGGAGARHVTTLLPHVSLPQEQPECARDGDTLLYDCGAWHVSVRWTVPRDAVSGVYLARLLRRDGELTWRTDNSQYPADARSASHDTVFTRLTQHIPGSPTLTMSPASCPLRPSPGLTHTAPRVTASSATASVTPRRASCTSWSGTVLSRIVKIG